jgi:hypothetical protein
MINRSALLIFSLLCITGLSWQRSAAQDRGDYAGSQSCAACHEAQVQGWSTTPHAKAFESLRKSSQQNLPGCVKCHVTGYEQKGGFIDHDLTPEMAGVQCEECHGPGRYHVDSGGDKASIRRAAGPDLCLRCHTPGQDKNFSYQKKVLLVHEKDTAGKPVLIAAIGGVEEPSRATALLKVEPLSKNFGEINEGVDAQLVATLTNAGQSDITITNVRTN